MIAEGVRAKRIPVNYAAHSVQVEQVRVRLLSELADISPQTAGTPVWSTVTRGWLDTLLLDADYWYRNLREPVELEDALENLGAKYDVFVEISPHPVLTVGIQETLENLQREATVVHSLRRDHGDMKQFLTELAHLFVCGFAVDWQGLFAGTGARRVDLPRYAFQHQRYWLEMAADSGDVSSAGLGVLGHPLLAATVELAGGGLVLTGRLGLGSQSWLADHAVGDVVLFPGTGFVELAVAAGDRVGCGRVVELILAAPLLLPEREAVQLQVVVSAADESGNCQISIHSRPEPAANTETLWIEHATGILAPAESDVGDDAIYELRVWPPADATEVDLTGIYERIAQHGYHYGPVFQGLERAWRRGKEVFAEVALPSEGIADTDSFVLHPALFDAALHTLLPGVTDAGIDGGLPFSWTEVAVHAMGASRVRVRLTPADDGTWSVRLADPEGRPVATVQALSLREASHEPSQVAEGTYHDSLFRQSWVQVTAGRPVETTHWLVLGSTSVADEFVTAGLGSPVPDLGSVKRLVDAGGPMPPVMIAVSAPVSDDVVADTYSRGSEMLFLVQDWLNDDRFSESLLMVVTQGAGGEAPMDLPGAAVRGLLKAAQSENPGRLMLIDIDQHAELSLLAGIAEIDEPDLLLRGNDFTAPRLVRVSAALAVPTNADSGQNTIAALDGFDRLGTVLITGGTGALGSMLARHLVIEHGVRHLILASRRGLQASGAEQLMQELLDLDAQVTVTACDVSDRNALAALIAAVPDQHPLRAVIHTAGMLEDGVFAAMSTEQFESVLPPKVDAAWHLHELTRELNLTAFVCYSSIAGVVGNAGQANYAAANAFLDALARHRGRLGLPATSLAWGLWEQPSSMTEHLDEIVLNQMARSALVPMSSATGMELFDAALRSGVSALVPAVLDLHSLQNRELAVPGIYRGLVRTVRRRVSATATDATFADRLVLLTEEQQRSLVEGLITKEVSEILGHDRRLDVTGEVVTFRDLGFDSLTSVEFKNRLTRITGVRLPATLAFDYPTIADVTDHLLGQLVGSAPSLADVILTKVADLEKLIANTHFDSDSQSKIKRGLDGLVAATSPRDVSMIPTILSTLNDSSDDEVVAFLNEQLGIVGD
ncbi:type I polyketide synthase [Nocardia asteroides]|uniref:type I polyketide synthase n=1 Tax=Nocardia asteroides TaxID=1824 RepID=UPI00341979D2